MAPHRFFIAIETPQEVKARIGEVIGSLKQTRADVRWEQIEKLHTTLKFLGETGDATLPHLISLIDKIAKVTSPFFITYASLGCFPNRREPRILWVGAESDSTLDTLAQEIESSLEELGFEKEKRKFHPHVTIGRVKSQRGMRDLIRMMESTTFHSQPTRVSHIVLKKSELQSSGSIYTTVQEFPLTRIAT